MQTGGTITHRTIQNTKPLRWRHPKRTTLEMGFSWFGTDQGARLSMGQSYVAGMYLFLGRSVANSNLWATGLGV
jgi:hypothetical protein